jgi:hypothetical protein
MLLTINIRVYHLRVYTGGEYGVAGFIGVVVSCGHLWLFEQNYSDDKDDWIEEDRVAPSASISYEVTFL